VLGRRGGILLEPLVVAQQDGAGDRCRDEVRGLTRHRVQHRLRDIVVSDVLRGRSGFEKP
jgi:hypothetical protein